MGDEHWNQLLSNEMKPFTLKDGLLYKGALMYVPGQDLRLRVLSEFHDSSLAGHAGMQKTLELISRKFWWLKLLAQVREYFQ